MMRLLGNRGGWARARRANEPVLDRGRINGADLDYHRNMRFLILFVLKGGSNELITILSAKSAPVLLLNLFPRES